MNGNALQTVWPDGYIKAVRCIKAWPQKKRSSESQKQKARTIINAENADFYRESIMMQNTFVRSL